MLASLSSQGRNLKLWHASAVDGAAGTLRTTFSNYGPSRVDLINTFVNRAGECPEPSPILVRGPGETAAGLCAIHHPCSGTSSRTDYRHFNRGARRPPPAPTCSTPAAMRQRA